MALQDADARNAKPKEKPYKLYDSDGLYLHVYPNGSRYWRLKYRLGGKEKKFAIGVYPDVTLKEARNDANAARKLVKKGIDPVINRRISKAQNIEKYETTFQRVADDWIRKNAGDWSPSYIKKVTGLLNNNVYASLGKLPISEITSTMVLATLRAMEDRDALELAAKTLRILMSIFRYASNSEMIDRSPLADIKATEVLKRRTVQNHPHLDRKQVGDFLRKLTDYHGKPETRIAVNLLLLTAVRTGELRAAQWEEINLQRKEWRIPAERMKTRKEHIVPLSRQAIALLKELKVHTGNSRYLFPGAGRPYFSENTVNKAIKLLGYGGKVVGHGFRGTFSTIANEEDNGFTPDMIERALAHQERNSVKAAYNHAEHMKPRRELMQWWADELDLLQHGGKVIQFTQGS